MLILITGGVKSGKSRRALDIVKTEWEFPVTFIATAEALDDDMRNRITRHRAERELLGGGGFVTVEEPFELGKARSASGARAVLDCIPMWISNLMYYHRENDFDRVLEEFLSSANDCVAVTNETGMGNIPFDEDTRRYNRLLAEANRRAAQAASRVELMVSGIPLRVK